MNTLVSLIIPVYNGKKRISSVLESIEHTVLPIEAIFIDDGSTDGSDEYISSWIESQNNTDTIHTLRLIVKENAGVASARNRGIVEARAPYVMFCDQDDRFRPKYIMKYIEAIKSSDVQVVVGGYERLRDDGKVIKRVRLSDTPWAKFIVPAPWAHIYNREFLVDNDIKFLASPIGEDIYFNILAYSKARRVVCIEDTSYKWMYNTSSVSNAKQNTIRDDIDPLFLLNNIYESIEDYEFRDSELLEYFFARYACWYMLFTSRGSKRADIDRQYHRLHDWLSRHYPAYEKNRYLGLSMPPGEVKSTHRFVYGYYLLRRMGLLSPVLKLLGE